MCSKGRLNHFNTLSLISFSILSQCKSWNRLGKQGSAGAMPFQGCWGCHRCQLKQVSVPRYVLPFAAGLWGGLVCDWGGGGSSTRPSSVSGEGCSACSSRGFGAVRGCSRRRSGGTCSKTSCAATLVTETEPQKSPVSCCINAGTGGAGAGCPQFCPGTLHPMTRWSVFHPIAFNLCWFGPGSSRRAELLPGCVLCSAKYGAFIFPLENRVSASRPCAAGWLLVLGTSMKS